MLVTRYITWWGLIANIIWAVLVLLSPHAMYATPLSTLSEFFNYSPYALSFALFSASVATFSAMASHTKPDLRTLALLLPQQFFMLMAAGGSIMAMWCGHYADGVQRSHFFIMADQMPWVLAALLYTISIVEYYWRTAKWKVTGLR